MRSSDIGRMMKIFPYLVIATAFCAGFGVSSIDRVTVVKGGGYFPVAIRLDSGEILAVLRGGGPHIGKAGRLDLVRSSDQGMTWSKPWTAVDGPEDDRNPALGQLADGTVFLAFAVLSGYDSSGLKLAGTRQDWVFDGVYTMRSKDRGRSWTRPERSPVIHSFYAGHGAVSPYGKIVQLGDGTVIMAVYFDFYDSRGHESYIFRSKDGGKTWGEPTLLAKGFNETAVVGLGSGRLLAAMRSGKGAHIAVTRSVDAGRTWSEPLRVTEDGEHPADLIRLKNGDILMSYGERNPPRGARALISRDDGETWEKSGLVVLADDAPNTDCGYPSSVEAAEGKIVSLYYRVDDLSDAPRSAKCIAVLWEISNQ